jgi:hypothetical protein
MRLNCLARWFQSRLPIRQMNRHRQIRLTPLRRCRLCRRQLILRC